MLQSSVSLRRQISAEAMNSVADPGFVEVGVGWLPFGVHIKMTEERLGNLGVLALHGIDIPVIIDRVCEVQK